MVGHKVPRVVPEDPVVVVVDKRVTVPEVQGLRIKVMQVVQVQAQVLLALVVVVVLIPPVVTGVAG